MLIQWETLIIRLQMEQSETDVKTLDILDVDTMGNSDYSIEKH